MRYNVQVHAKDEEKARGMSQVAKFDITEVDNIAEAIVRSKATLEGLTSDQLDAIVKIQIQVADEKDKKVRFHFPTNQTVNEPQKGKARKGSSKSGK